MQLQQAIIINLAVNIFQNVGIKRYIGQIQALRHEDIYFEIYKIIFPNSMINIFKISQSNLTTGQKIQKIIQQISSIIKLDLYHISGQAIAQGNRHHLTNWLQLLQALSNNCIYSQPYHRGGSVPDRDREMYKEFEEEQYFTVQGVNGEFEKHVYTDEKPEDSDSQNYGEAQVKVKNKEKEKDNRNQKQISHGSSQKKKDLHHEKNKESSEDKDYLNRSFVKSESSKNSNVLKPIDSTKKKPTKSSKTQNKDKKVAFNLEYGLSQGRKNTEKEKVIVNRPQYGTKENLVYPFKNEPSKNQLNHLLLRKKKIFLQKMNQIQEQMQRKKINDEITKFQSWVHDINQSSTRDTLKIHQQNQQRNQYINKKIASRQNFIKSLSGHKQAMRTIKQIFKKQKQNEKRITKAMRQQQIKQALQLMDLNFAADAQNMMMASIQQ